ncbi:MAG: class I tRNA ligase family protein, partial [Nitrospirota bacterium]|nr:class I tRNA ligase family protein [Nitrospirota bacterium]
VTTDEQAPYRAVLTHGFVLDGEGKKMSKSAGNVVTPQEIIKESGAEILRLWVASQDYQEDLRISKEIVKQLMDAYRKVRNTCRFLLSNLYDYDPAVHMVSHADLPELDQWALWRLGQLIDNVKKGYAEFEFRQVVHELDYFCSTDMSATYLDILKDRLYTFPANSPLRRGSQTVLFEVVTALAKLMAPILSFTAEEIWQVLPDTKEKGSKLDSVHLAEFPTSPTVFGNPGLHSRWNYLFQVRRVAQAALEKTRRDKVIGSSLEAKVVLKATEPQSALLKQYLDELPALFIVSCVEVETIANIDEKDHDRSHASLGLTIHVLKAEGTKCDRCWNIRNDVGLKAEHPTLCSRCVEAVA